jgi:hypothetical protein
VPPQEPSHHLTGCACGRSATADRARVRNSRPPSSGSPESQPVRRIAPRSERPRATSFARMAACAS